MQSLFRYFRPKCAAKCRCLVSSSGLPQAIIRIAEFYAKNSTDSISVGVQRWPKYLPYWLANPTSLPILKSLPSVVAEISKGNTQICRAPLAQGHAHFSSGCDFMMGLGKAHLPANLEVAAEILKGNPKFWGAPLAHGHAHFFLWVILWWALANPNSVSNMKSLPSAVAKILTEIPKFWGAPLAHRHAHFFSWCDFMMAWQTQAAHQIWNR